MAGWGGKNTPDKLVVKTPIGDLECTIHKDLAYPGFTVCWNGRQIAVIESAAPNMRVLVWDTDKEDPSTVTPVFPGYGE